MTLTMKGSVCRVRGLENSEKTLNAASEMAAGEEILLIFVCVVDVEGEELLY